VVRAALSWSMYEGFMSERDLNSPCL
jgi:hypothetical protein